MSDWTLPEGRDAAHWLEAVPEDVRTCLRNVVRHAQFGEHDDVGQVCMSLARSVARVRRFQPPAYPIIAVGVDLETQGNIVFQLVHNGEARVLSVPRIDLLHLRQDRTEERGTDE